MLPRVILHNAVSLDGRIDGFTPDIGLFYQLVSHWNEDATLAGCDTLLAAPEAGDEGESEPAGMAPDDTRPLLVVPDSRGRIANWGVWRRQPYWRDVVVLCSTATPPTYLAGLERQGIAALVAGDDHVDLRAALEMLHEQYGVKVVRADSGGTLNGALLRAGLVDEVSVLVHPALVGGTTPRSLFRAPDLTTPEGAIGLRLAHLERLEGDVVWLRYEVMK